MAGLLDCTAKTEPSIFKELTCKTSAVILHRCLFLIVLQPVIKTLLSRFILCIELSTRETILFPVLSFTSFNIEFNN